MMPLSVSSVHILNKRIWFLDAIFIFLQDECSICSDSTIPLRNWQIHESLTWDVDSSNTSHIKKQAPSIGFPSFELYRKTRKSAPAAQLVSRVSSSASFHAIRSSFIKLFILKESALLITANDTHIRRRRALFNNESTFLSPGGDVTNYTLLVYWNKLPLVFFQANTGQKISPTSPKWAWREMFWLQGVFCLNFTLTASLLSLWEFQENKQTTHNRQSLLHQAVP